MVILVIRLSTIHAFAKAGALSGMFSALERFSLFIGNFSAD
jgi:hypothetical protein